MKIKLYIVSYNNPKILNDTINSLFNSDYVNYHSETFIINNHSNFNLHNYHDKITVLHNVVRPDFSTGHLSRNWNEAIVNGFKNLNNPDCNFLMHCQDDTIFEKEWVQKIIDLHQQYSFIQMGIGDSFCSYTPEAIKTIGLWDERFCNIGYQEADYFLRTLIYNKNKSCLNDYQHGRLINNVNYTICHRPEPPHIFSPDHHKSMAYHHISEKIFKRKWPNIPPNYWTSFVYNHHPHHSAIDNFIYYPYFEKDIIDLQNKKYII